MAMTIRTGAQKKAAEETVDIRPAMWPEDEFFTILARKSRGGSSDAKNASYEEYKDERGRKKFRLNADTLQRELIKIHLKGWRVRADPNAPAEIQTQEKGWIDFTPETVEGLEEGPAAFIENEINARAGWLADIDMEVKTASGTSTADFPGSSDPLA